jgi:hypothetical protein
VEHREVHVGACNASPNRPDIRDAGGAPSAGSFLNIPAVGSGAQGAQFTGNFHLTGFHFDTGTVYADGIVTGVLTNSSGATLPAQPAFYKQ